MIRIINIRDYPQWLERAAKYFAAKWSADETIYADSMNDSIATDKPTPRWYLMLDCGGEGEEADGPGNNINGCEKGEADGPGGVRIIGAFGLIDNDYMVRTDLRPWLCGLYVEPAERGRGLGAKLLAHGRREAAALGFDKVWLNTDHKGYYEKYGWRYYGDYEHQSGAYARVYEADATRVETPRLILRPFTESDAAAAGCNSAQAAAMRYLPDMVWETEGEALEFIRRFNMDYFDESTPRVMLAVTLKDGGRCVGFAGIGPKAELDDEIELGYLIAEEYRNNGYATEAAKAMVWLAFERFGLDVLSAVAMPENKASRRVLEKLGCAYGGARTFADGNIFDYFRLYHTDTLPGPDWDISAIYKPEKMGDFFDVRADGYNDHMLSIGLSGGSNADYIKFGDCFPTTDAALKILNVGCGTGLELDFIWKRTPNAHIVCVDISRGMLDLLLKNHPDSHAKLTVVEASFADWAYPAETFDIVASHAAMHHLWPDEKIKVYRKMLSTLVCGGHYIEGDFMVEPILAEQYRIRYEKIIKGLPEKPAAGEYHIDIPFTPDVQIELLRGAGFARVETLDEKLQPHGSGAILRAWKK